MATRSGTSYMKRQKELARQDKQREKAAKRAQRKLQKQSEALGLETSNTPMDASGAQSSED
jgi:hypothetical protein